MTRRASVAAACLVLTAGVPARAAGDAALEVWVSILPQTEIVERVGGSRVRVHALVQPGHSPSTYEPTPRQLAALWEADLLVRTGVPFEQSLLAKVASIHPQLKILNASSDIELAPLVESHGGHDHAGMDPHVWLDPTLVARQATTVRDALCDLAPRHCNEFDANLAAYTRQLDEVDDRVRAILAPVAGRTLHVFHPAYGYFARRYGLHQAAVELAGKEPTPRRMTAFVEEARRSGARVLFVQPQLLGTGAKAAASALGAELVELDPLAPDLAANLERMATRIAAAWRKP
jgi:zinc transport system substrate-binding protein